MYFKKIVLLGFVFVIFSISVYSQIKTKSHKIEMGCHATYFFDDRGFQLGEINNYFPFGIIRSYAYSISKNNFQSAFQIRLTAFHSVSREQEFWQNKIFDKSFREVYSYISIIYLKELLKQSRTNSNLLLGITYRSAIDRKIIFALNDYFYENNRSNDFSFSIGLKYEVDLFKKFYIYVQPLYNFYFLRTNKEFLRNEIIGNLGFGYRFNTQKRK
jgi:hypothetical protein